MSCSAEDMWDGDSSVQHIYETLHEHVASGQLEGGRRVGCRLISVHQRGGKVRLSPERYLAMLHIKDNAAQSGTLKKSSR